MIDAEAKVMHIKQHPELHRHDFAGLQQCSFIDGHLDMMVMEAHSKYAGQRINGGKRCDVSNGPCSCGAWH